MLAGQPERENQLPGAWGVESEASGTGRGRWVGGDL